VTTWEVNDNASDPDRPHAVMFTGPDGASRAYVFPSAVSAASYIEWTRRCLIDGVIDRPLDDEELARFDAGVRVAPVLSTDFFEVQSTEVAGEPVYLSRVIQ
jgi:hypothetical protein